MKEREINIITNGGFEVKLMHEAERESFMSALLERVLELQLKQRKEDGHAT